MACSRFILKKLAAGRETTANNMYFLYLCSLGLNCMACVRPGQIGPYYFMGSVSRSMKLDKLYVLDLLASVLHR